MAAQAPAGNPSSLATHDSQLALKVKQLSQMLSARGAKNGARRLEEVSQQFQHFTVEGASHYIRKDEIIDELEDRGRWWLSGLLGLRNLLSIAPIAFTWWALHLAADAYDHDLQDSHYAGDLYQPFLRLWQDGFHGNHGFVIPFSTAALLDAVLLVALIILAVVVIPSVQRLYRERIHDSLEDFDATIDELLAAIGQAGASAHLADSDIDKISRAIQGTLQKVLLNYDRVAGEARKFIEDTHQSTQTLVKNFDDNLAVFNGDVRLLTNDLQRMNTDLTSYGQKLAELTDASNKLAVSSTDLALNAKNMADSAQLSAQASQGISSQLGDLNVAQKEIVKTQQDVASTISQTQGDVVKQFATTQQNVVQEIERAQKEVVKEISSVADDMNESTKNTRDVARELENVAQGLKQMTQADFQAMTDGIKKANQDLFREVQKVAQEFQQVAGNLNQVGTQLQSTTKALAGAAQTFGSATGKPRPLARRVAYSSAAVAAVAALAVIGELAVLIMRIH